MWRWVLIAVLAALVAFPASADIKKGDGDVGFDLGLTRFDADDSDELSGCVTVRGGYHFANWFELEGQLGGMATPTLAVGGKSERLAVFMVNGVFDFRSSRNVTPYLLVGLGGARRTVDSYAVNLADDGFAWQGAGGLRFFVGAARTLAIRLELSALTEKTFDAASTHMSLRVGLTWTVGRRSSARAARPMNLRSPLAVRAAGRRTTRPR